MRSISAISTIVLMALVSCQGFNAQSRDKKPKTRAYLEEVKKHPDLGVNYSQVAKFKLSSRKKVYRFGELISIDLALMNSSKLPVRFQKLSRPSLGLKAQDTNGRSVLVDEYYTVLAGTTPESYELVESGYLISESFQLLAGCDDDGLRAYRRATAKLQEEEHRGGERSFFTGLFERDLFVNWGDACFAVKRSGTYVIAAEQSNDNVVVLTETPKVKTAVGTIRSAPLTITIIE